MSTQLLRNATSIGDIFFSGSQTVKKGVEAIWILTDTWAFKATEKCRVSTNASPFITLSAGQTIIIHKRTQADIDAGNHKGIYIFDRDTVVALAYPQEVTQDIIIENDIYNDNVQHINIVNDVSPTAIIMATPTTPEIGESCKIQAGSSYNGKGVTGTLKYVWYLNGVFRGGSEWLSFIPTKLGTHEAVLMVTDVNGRKDSTTRIIESTGKTTPDQDVTGEGKSGRAIGTATFMAVDSVKIGLLGTGDVDVRATIPIKVTSDTDFEIVYMFAGRVVRQNLSIRAGQTQVAVLNENWTNLEIKATSVFSVSVNAKTTGAKYWYVGTTGGNNKPEWEANLTNIK